MEEALGVLESFGYLFTNGDWLGFRLVYSRRSNYEARSSRRVELE